MCEQWPVLLRVGVHVLCAVPPGHTLSDSTSYTTLAAQPAFAAAASYQPAPSASSVASTTSNASSSLAGRREALRAQLRRRTAKYAKHTHRLTAYTTVLQQQQQHLEDLLQSYAYTVQRQQETAAAMLQVQRQLDELAV